MHIAVLGIDLRPPARPLDIPEHDWSEAVRRERVVRPLAVADINSGAAIKAAAGALGLSQTQVYRLIATFREHPTTVSLVVTRPGGAPGESRTLLASGTGADSGSDSGMRRGSRLEAGTATVEIPPGAITGLIALRSPSYRTFLVALWN